MLVGLGTGSTAYFAVERVGQKLKSGELKDVRCIPTSVRTKEQAEKLKIPLITLNDLPKGKKLDVAIDGADAVDPDMCLIKGGGGALSACCGGAAGARRQGGRRVQRHKNNIYVYIYIYIYTHINV